MGIGALRVTETGEPGGLEWIGGGGLGVRCETRTYNRRLDETIGKTGERPSNASGQARIGVTSRMGNSPIEVLAY